MGPFFPTPAAASGRTVAVNRQGLERVGLVVAAGVAFGVVMSVLKGNGAGARDDLGNVSAPWLILPFVAAAYAAGRRLGRAATVGGAVSLAALAGFYVTNSFVLKLGPHSRLDDLRLAVDGAKEYFVPALLSGPVFGVLGGWWQRARSAVLGVGVAALLVVEPLAWWLYSRLDHGYFSHDTAVWTIEVLVGIVACVAAVAVSRPFGGAEVT